MRLTAGEFEQLITACQGLAILVAHVLLTLNGGSRPPTPAPRSNTRSIAVLDEAEQAAAESGLPLPGLKP
jgi:hypothetical protein